MTTRITHPMDRREFLQTAAAALFAGVAIQVLGCDDGTSSVSTDLSGVISAPDTPNHGHVATLTRAQINAAGAVTIDIMGTANHTHTVDLTAQEMASIKAGTQVAKITSAGVGHYHTVTFN